MDLLSLEVIVISAEGLNKLEPSAKMTTYVVATLTDDASTDQKFETNMDSKGGKNPRWNFPMKFIVDRSAASSLLSFTLVVETDVGDEYIGHVKLPVAKLMHCVEDGRNSMQYVTYPIMGTSGHTTRGMLNFSYRFRASQARVRHVQQGPEGNEISIGDCNIQSFFPADEIVPFGIGALAVESIDILDDSINELMDVPVTSVIESVDVSDASIVESGEGFDAS